MFVNQILRVFILYCGDAVADYSASTSDQVSPQRLASDMQKRAGKCLQHHIMGTKLHIERQRLGAFVTGGA